MVMTDQMKSQIPEGDIFLRQFVAIMRESDAGADSYDCWLKIQALWEQMKAQPKPKPGQSSAPLRKVSRT